MMRRIGVHADNVTQVRGRIGLGLDGAPTHRLDVPAVTSAWSSIWRPLRRAMPGDRYRGAMTLERADQDAAQVVAEFSDGSRLAADLLIAADGLHSGVRTRLLSDLRPRYAGYVAWRGVIDQRDAAPEFHDLLFRHMLFGFPDGELLLSIPMPGPGPGPGSSRCHFVWFRRVPETALPDLCTDASGRQHGSSIPPSLIRTELIEALKRDANELLAPQLAGLVTAAERIILQPIFDLESPRIAFGRIALLGDAAFVARPQVASGVMKAAIDAETLAHEMQLAGNDVITALERYNAQRQPYGAWLVARGQHIGGYLASRDGDPRDRIATLMREYGSSGVVGREPMAARR